MADCVWRSPKSLWFIADSRVARLSMLLSVSNPPSPREAGKPVPPGEVPPENVQLHWTSPNSSHAGIIRRSRERLLRKRQDFVATRRGKSSRHQVFLTHSITDDDCHGRLPCTRRKPLILLSITSPTLEHPLFSAIGHHQKV